MNKKLDIVGSRVRIKNFKKKDISKKYIEWLNDLKVTQFSNQRFKKHTFETCLSYLDSFKNSSNYFLNISDNKTNKMIGTMTFYQDKNHKTVDVGIMVGESNIWGLGYGQEAWNLALDFLLKSPDINKITAGTVRPNTAMIRIMENSCMKLEAVKKSQELIGENFEDLLYYARFNTNFKLKDL